MSALTPCPDKERPHRASAPLQLSGGAGPKTGGSRPPAAALACRVAVRLGRSMGRCAESGEKGNFKLSLTLQLYSGPSFNN